MPLFDSVRDLEAGRKGLRRRHFLLTAVTGVAAWYGYRWWRFRPTAVSNRTTSFQTSNADFYTVSIKPGFYPKVDLERWRLQVEVDGVLKASFDYQQLRALPVRSIVRTLECIGNTIGGRGIGNAQWTVTSLGDLLAPLTASRHDGWGVTFHALDGFYSSVPLEVALAAETWLAYEMNGEPLPVAHGFPLRVLLPDRYGMKQPRWLERIAVTSPREKGYWESSGWSDEARIQMMARIDSAQSSTDGNWIVKGIAYCGASGVGGVEIQVQDEGWRPCRLTSKAQPHAWATWEAQWTPLAAGRYVIAARVRDTGGRRQVESYTGNYPSGVTGLHQVIVEV